MKKILLSVLTACGVWSAQSALVQYTVSLSGPNESPVNASPGIGNGTVTYDNVTHLLQLEVTFSGLIATNTGTTASHIHAATAVPGVGTAGVATQTPSFVGFPLGVTSGSFANTLDLTSASSYNPAYVTAQGSIANAEAALVAAMAGGQAYWNIHSGALPGGEIRGFLVPIPEPSTYLAGALLFIPFGVHGIRYLRSRKQIA
jgi:hypothetical protein